MSSKTWSGSGVADRRRKEERTMDQPGLRFRGMLLPLFLGALLWAGGPIRAQQISFSTDIPVTLSGTTYQPNEIIQYRLGGYSLKFEGDLAGMDASANIVAVTNLTSTDFLFCVDAPFTYNGTTYQASDIIRYTASPKGLSLYQSASALGIPASAEVDALGRDSGGNLLLSFDVPVTIGGVTYQPDDIVKVSGTSLSMYLQGSAAGLPAGTDVTGFEAAGSSDYYMFHNPVTLGGTTYMPGQVVKYDGSAFSLFFDGSGIPATAMGTGFALSGAGGVGAVPDGTQGGTPLTITKYNTSGLTLSWGASCSSAATDYTVYEGTLGSWNSETSAACSTGGGKTTTISLPPGDHFFLIVPHDSTYEGSYGTDSSGNQRPRASSPCESASSPSCQ